LNIGRYDYLCTHNYADMVKLVDMPDLGSGAARRVGSSPIIRTKSFSNREAFFVLTSLLFSNFRNDYIICFIIVIGYF
jgi:hypothetical protein